MKTCLAVALSSVPCATSLARGKVLINDPERIRNLNAVPESTWVAGHQEFFEGMTFDDARVILGTALSHISNHLNETLDEEHYTAIPDSEVPTTLDARQKWPDLMHPIRNQKQCGSCWAFSASEVLSDRVAIASKKPSPVLSPEELVSCDWFDHGCHGGMLWTAWRYLTHWGLVTDSCMPYTAGGGSVGWCPHTCADSQPLVRTKATSSYAIKGVPNMQKDMMKHGPIQVAFSVYPSFMSYKSGVYHKHKDELIPEGGHAVKMIGWGKDGKLKYWLVANSWGSKWGDQGYFKIRRGVDSCGIETMGPPYAGLPGKPEEELLVV